MSPNNPRQPNGYCDPGVRARAIAELEGLLGELDAMHAEVKQMLAVARVRQAAGQNHENDRPASN